MRGTCESGIGGRRNGKQEAERQGQGLAGGECQKSHGVAAGDTQFGLRTMVSKVIREFDECICFAREWQGALVQCRVRGDLESEGPRCKADFIKSGWKAGYQLRGRTTDETRKAHCVWLC